MDLSKNVSEDTAEVLFLKAISVAMRDFERRKRSQAMKRAINKKQLELQLN